MEQYFIIGADVVPTKINESLFCDGNQLGLVGEQISALLKAASYRIFNLETPLTNQETPIKKYGPALRAKEETVAGYKALGADLLTLANNHIMDHGVTGFHNTRKVLEANGISFVGAGENIREARQPFFFNFAEKNIGVFACAEHEFSIAGEDKPGANPYENYLTDQTIKKIKAECEYLIVLYHGGKELYRYPSPDLQKRCRAFTEHGADLVVCQHSHCIGCRENHHGGEIIYGQGNFIFHLDRDESWKTGLLIKINERFEITYVPIVNDYENVVAPSLEKEKEILAEFNSRSKQIEVDGFVRKTFNEYARKIQKSYYVRMSGLDHNFFYLVCSKLNLSIITDFMIRRRISEQTKLAAFDYMECETHREILRVGISDGE